MLHSSVGEKLTQPFSLVFTELSETPFGTGTLFALSGDGDVLHRQSRCINVTEREEGIVAQYLARPEGHASFLRAIEAEVPGGGYRLERIFSGLHAGQGRLWFGSSRHQRSDYALFFTGRGPAYVYYVNYHGMYYHYTGHEPECELREPEDSRPHEVDTATARLDSFRQALAGHLSSLAPASVQFRYTALTACQLFHFADRSYDLEDHLQRIAPRDACLPRAESLWRKAWLHDALVEDILDGSATGFVTLSQGFEDYSAGCLLEKNFGFCVQKRRPAPGELSDFTLSQIAGREGQDAEAYMRRMPERTFAARSFFGGEGETMSTTYFSWLVRERGLHSYKITHFLRYKFCDYSRDFLEPILERRHLYKKAGESVGAETLKLVANGSFGYTALESRNYDTTLLKTDLSLRRNRFQLSSNFSMKNVSFVGVVKTRSDCRGRGRKRSSSKRKDKKDKRRRRRSGGGGRCFLDEAAAVDDDDDDEDPPQQLHSGEEEEEEDALDFDHSEMTGVRVEGEEDDADDFDDDELEEEGDVAELVCGDLGTRKPKKYDYKFLYAVTVTGRYKRIENCLPRAVSILSNSKRIFLGLVLSLLRAADPAKIEPVYCDTDSIILSATHPTLDENLLPGGAERLAAEGVIGEEGGATSIHGKLKLEGVFSAGLFRALKVYRLFGEEELEAGAQEEEEEQEEVEEEEEEYNCGHPSLKSLKSVYTRCKGVSRFTARSIGTHHFEPAPKRSVGGLKVHRISLRPTRAGEMSVQLERKTLAQPYNFKRHVTPDGLHTLPFD